MIPRDPTDPELFVSHDMAAHLARLERYRWGGDERRVGRTVTPRAIHAARAGLHALRQAWADWEPYTPPADPDAFAAAMREHVAEHRRRLDLLDQAEATVGELFPRADAEPRERGA